MLAQVDLVVDVEGAQGVQLLVAHAADEAVPHRLRRFHQDLAVLVCIHRCHSTWRSIRRQGFQRIGDIGGGRAVDQPGQLAGLVPKLCVLLPLRVEQALGEGVIGQQQREDAGSVVLRCLALFLGEGHEAEF